MIQLCRVCLAAECQLYPLAAHKMMHETYEMLTGLMLEDKLPPYLCGKCALQLLASTRFRTRSLRAHIVLLEIVNKQGKETVESIQSLNGSQMICMNSRHDEIEIETVLTQEETLNVEDVLATSDCIKEEIDEIDKLDIFKDEAVVDADDCVPDLSADIAVDSVKEDNEAMIEKSPQLSDSESTFGDMRHEDRLEGEDYASDDELPLEAIRQYVNQKTEEQELETAIKDEDQQNANDNGISEHDSDDFTQLLSCDICSYKTREDTELLNHLKSHTEKFKCNLSDFKSSTKQLLTRHSYKHTEVAPFLCDNCGKVFAGSSALRKHKLVHSVEQPHVCMVCKAAFTYKYQLNSHVQRTLSCQKLYICDVCQSGLKSKKSLIIHLKSHARLKPFKCKFCNKEFFNKNMFLSHLGRHTGDKPFECDICHKSFISNQGLRLHYKSCLDYHTDENISKYTCDICNMSFKSKRYIARHFRVHSGKKPQACHICNLRLSSKSSLVRHLPMHKIDFVIRPGVKIYMCDICKRAFNKKSTFLEHKRNNHNELRPYKCKICGKSFTGKINLSHHVIVHSTEKPHKCHICDKSFSRTNYLTEHLRIHSGVKPYTCDVCNKSFTVKKTLKIHMKLHMNK